MVLTVPEAEQELAAAIALEATIAGELLDIDKQLSESERTAGDRSLEARKAGNTKQVQKINDELLKLRNLRDVTKSTYQAAREAIKNAKHEVNLAKARVLRAEAAKIGEEVNKRLQKTTELLEALFEHEGIRYLAEPKTHGGVYLAGTTAESRTMKLAQEAEALIRQAVTLENQVCRVEPDPSRDGRVSNAIKV